MYQILVGTPDRTRPLWRPRLTNEGNIFKEWNMRVLTGWI